MAAKRGRPAKSETALPADRIRAKAFAFALRKIAEQEVGGARLEDVQAVLRDKFKAEVSNNVAKWLSGAVRPNNTYSKLLKRHLPEVVAWLDADITHPARRFICGLDALWSRPDSAFKQLTFSDGLHHSVGDILNALKLDWGPIPVLEPPSLDIPNYDNAQVVCGFAAPCLRQLILLDIVDAYDITNPLSLLNCMVLYGSTNKIEFNDQEFDRWAIDLATMATIALAHLENFPGSYRLMPASSCSSANIIYNFFFKTTFKESATIYWEQALKESIPQLQDAPFLVMQLKKAKEKLSCCLLGAGINPDWVEKEFASRALRNEKFRGEARSMTLNQLRTLNHGALIRIGL